MSDVFISYSRKDSDFARKLTNNLAETGRDIWVDWEDIPRAVDWLHEIYAGIEAADTFVFIVSQNSLTSEICNLEVERALQHNKRIIPLILQEIRDDVEKYVKGTWFDQEWLTLAQENWRSLGHLNWIFFNDDARFDSEFDALIIALETDLNYVKLHTRLLVRAREWETASRSPSFLLTGEEIDDAQTWLKLGTSEDKQPNPTNLHKSYVIVSRKRDLDEKQRLDYLIEAQKASEQQAEVAQKASQRSKRLAWVAGVATIIAIIIGVMAGLQAIDAQSQADTAKTEVFIAGETLTPLPATLDASYRFQMAGQASFQQSNENDALAFAFEAISNQQPLIDVQPIFYEIVGNSHNRMTLSGHSDWVNSVAFSPDGTTLVSASDDQTLKLWDVATGDELQTLSGYTSEKDASVTFSPDGSTLAVASCPKLQEHGNCIGGEIKLWNVATGDELQNLSEHTSLGWSVAFSPDGKTLAFGSCRDVSGRGQCIGGEIKLWDVATSDILATLSGHFNTVSSVAFSPDGKTLASASWDNTIKLWNVATSDIPATLSGHDGSVHSVAFSPDGNTLASASSDNTIKLWNVATSDILVTLSGHSATVRSVAFSPDGTTLASASSDNTIKLWNVATSDILATLSGHSATVRSVAFSPDGTTLVSASNDTTIKLWDVATGNELQSLNGHSVFSSSDQTIKLWDAATSDLLETLNGQFESVMAVSPDGNTLTFATCSRKGLNFFGNCIEVEFKLWNIATGDELQTLTGHDSLVNSVAFSPDSKTLASASSREIKLWDVATGDVLHTLNGHDSLVNSVAFSPDGNIIASCASSTSSCIQGEIKLWDVATGSVLHTLNGHSGDVWSVTFSPDGKILSSSGCGEKDLTGATCIEGEIRMWNISSLALMRQWVQENRFIREFTCEERIRFNMPVQCGADGDFLTRTPYPTPSPIFIPTLDFTPFWVSTATATP